MRWTMGGDVVAFVLSALLLATASPGSLPITATLAAQSPPSFEIASIKLNTSGSGRVLMNIQPGGRFLAQNVTPLQLIRSAYQLQDFQIVGASEWAQRDRYDISAKSDLPDAVLYATTSGPNAFQLMMRGLLADRMKLQTHTESRDLPIYNLVSLGRRGPGLVHSTIDCAAWMAPGRGGPPPALPGGRPPCGLRSTVSNLLGGAVTIEQLVNALALVVQRTVVDKTDLSGQFDVELTFAPDPRDLPGNAPPPVAPVTIDPNAPSLFTAIQEQLGLKLESARGPVPVLVIDRLEHPTPD